ncbi:hypothetical protein DY000_02014981 [Brassica cretica]|uniref:Aminotransferase-like plant mobile domain-containing protein n=1 Tax=Brassica cretica TaxID=69181 RepID=A0ABQ7D2I5_BRACR|nr:hypothetical protein DY000_02014981 [Brassica cretica]
MWTVWSLENDLVIRRLHEDPGIIGEGGAGAPLGSLDCIWDPEVPVRLRGLFLRSEDRIGALMHLDHEAFEALLEPGGFDPEIDFWNPEEPGGSSLDLEIFDWNPEAIGEPRVSSLDFIRTVLRLPRQDYYRKSLTCLEGAVVGVMTQVPGLRCFPRLGKQDFDCSMYFTVLLQSVYTTGVLGSFDNILRLAHTHSCFMSRTRFDSSWACHCARATFMRFGQDQRSLET